MLYLVRQVACHLDTPGRRCGQKTACGEYLVRFRAGVLPKLEPLPQTRFLMELGHPNVHAAYMRHALPAGTVGILKYGAAGFGLRWMIANVCEAPHLSRNT